jgi:hypothetical protein
MGGGYARVSAGPAATVTALATTRDLPFRLTLIIQAATVSSTRTPAVAAHLGAALKAGGNRDYTLVVLPKGHHEQFEAKVGSNVEMPSLRRMVPAYFTTIEDWLSTRIRGFGPRD